MLHENSLFRLGYGGPASHFAFTMYEGISVVSWLKASHSQQKSILVFI